MAEPTHRVRTFVDFSNFQINWNAYQAKAGATQASPVPIPWKDLAGVLIAEIAKGQPLRFTGAHVYACP